MLLWNGLLVLFVLLAGFPWNTARPQLHLLSLTVKKTDVKPRISHCDSQNLQYKTHPEFWPSHRRIFKTSLYYKTRLILETRRYIFLAPTHRYMYNIRNYPNWNRTYLRSNLYAASWVDLWGANRRGQKWFKVVWRSSGRLVAWCAMRRGGSLCSRRCLLGQLTRAAAMEVSKACWDTLGWLRSIWPEIYRCQQGMLGYTGLAEVNVTWNIQMSAGHAGIHWAGWGQCDLKYTDVSRACWDTLGWLRSIWPEIYRCQQGMLGYTGLAEVNMTWNIQMSTGHAGIHWAGWGQYDLKYTDVSRACWDTLGWLRSIWPEIYRCQQGMLGYTGLAEVNVTWNIQMSAGHAGIRWAGWGQYDLKYTDVSRACWDTLGWLRSIWPEINRCQQGMLGYTGLAEVNMTWNKQRSAGHAGIHWAGWGQCDLK